VPQDYATAVGWYRKSADQGDAEAQSDLGYMYAEGKGVPQDYTEAVRWYHKAADQGYARGQDGLGYAYSHGAGVPQRVKAGLPEDLVLYCGRHDYGTRILKRTGNLAAVMRTMGHRDVKTAMQYQHPELEIVRAALDQDTTVEKRA
jgi:TPR repeat protein